MSSLVSTNNLEWLIPRTPVACPNYLLVGDNQIFWVAFRAATLRGE